MGDLRNFSYTFGGLRKFSDRFGGLRNVLDRFGGLRNFLDPFGGLRNFSDPFRGSWNELKIRPSPWGTSINDRSLRDELFWLVLALESRQAVSMDRLSQTDHHTWPEPHHKYHFYFTILRFCDNCMYRLEYGAIEWIFGE